MNTTHFKITEKLDILIFSISVFCILFGLFFAIGAIRCYIGNFIIASSNNIFVPDIFLPYLNRSIEPRSIESMEIKQFDKKSSLFIYLKNDRAIVIGGNAIPEMTLDDLKVIFEECKKNQSIKN